MTVVILIVLLVVAILLFALEIFVLPGISIAGLGAAVAYVYAFYYAFTELGNTAGMISILVAVISIVGCVVWFMKSKTVDRLSLKETLASPENPIHVYGLKVGDSGRTVTKLSLIGKALIHDALVEVHSADGFIDEKTPVKIIRIENNTVYVSPIEESC